ncbi:MAG: DNA polymerase III subunit delta [Gaiellaceae bacterium]
MAEPKLKAAYLIFGSDRPKVELAVRRLRDRFGPDAVERLEASETSGAEAVAACNAGGLFASGGRAVIVEGVERWKAADAKAIGAYLDDPAPGTVLAMAAEQLRRDSALAKAVGKRGQILSFDVARKELPGWVQAQLRERGVTASAGVARELIELVGEDMHELACEVDKLATWADGEQIGERELELLVCPRGERAPFGLTDAWGRRDVRAALAAYELLLERASEPRPALLAKLAALLASHIGKVQACRRLSQQGLGPREAAARLGMHPYYAEKAFAQARNFSEAELRRATVRLAQLDLALKGGSRLPSELEFERALIDLTGTGA